MGLDLLTLQWKQQDCMVATRKKCLFLKLDCELMEIGNRIRLCFWMRESSNCVEHVEKETFRCPIVIHTFLRPGLPTSKFSQTCTITQTWLIFRGFNLWIPRAKNLDCTN